MSETWHRVFIKKKDASKEDEKEYLYENIQELKADLTRLFEYGDVFDIFYELNLEAITVEDYIEVLNLNPYLADISNKDNCKTALEYQEWINACNVLYTIEEVLNNKDTDS